MTLEILTQFVLAEKKMIKLLKIVLTQLYACIERDKGMDGWTDGWIDRQMDGWTDGWKDGRMDSLMFLFMAN